MKLQPRPGFFWLLSTGIVAILPAHAALAAAPTAVAQRVLTGQNAPITITLRGVSPTREGLHFAIAGEPAHGTLGPLEARWQYQAKVVYTPYNSYMGPDSFTFTVSNGGGVSVAGTVSITVGYAVSGRIVDAGGNPVPNVTLRFRPTGGSPNRYATTGEDGTYWVPLPPEWSGTAVSRDPEVVITPGVRSYTAIRSNLMNHDYVTGGPAGDPSGEPVPGETPDPGAPPNEEPPNQPPPSLPKVTRSYYVATNGDDSNPGTLEAPFATIQKAAGIVQPGEGICIRGGDYDIRKYPKSVICFARSGEPDKPIVVTAYGDEKVTIFTAESKAVFDFGTWWGNNTAGFGHYVFSKLRFNGARCVWMFYPPAVPSWTTSQPVSNLWVGQIHDIVIEDCEVDGNGTIQSAVYARNAGVRNLTVRRCNFHHTIGTEGTIDLGEWTDEDKAHAVPASASHNILIEDCDLHDVVHQQGNGIVTQPCVFNVTIRRCRVWNNGKYGIAFKGSGNFKVDRCAVWGNRETSMYCRGFGGDSGAARPPAPNDFLITNSIFIAPADQSGGSALNWRENCSIAAYNCTIVGLRNTIYKQSGGYAWLLGNDHAIPCVAALRNCIVVGLNNAPAVRFYTPNGLAYPINVRYEAGTNLFYCTASPRFRMQKSQYAELTGWQGYWAAGTPGGDDGLHGPRATNADADSIWGDPLFVLMNPAAPLGRQWAAHLFDPANGMDVRLRAGSPAIGAGQNLSSLNVSELAVDFEGNPRPATGAWTIGAIERPVQ